MLRAIMQRPRTALPSPAATWRSHAHPAPFAACEKRPDGASLLLNTARVLHAAMHSCISKSAHSALLPPQSASACSARTGLLVGRRCILFPTFAEHVMCLSEACSVTPKTQLLYSNAYPKTHWHKAVFDTASTARRREPKASART